MLDIDENQLLSKNEFEHLFRWKDLTSFYIYLSKTQEESDLDLTLDDYIKAMLTNRLAFNIDSNIVLSNRWQGYVECKIIRNPWFGWCSLIVGILPGMLGGLLNGLWYIPSWLLNVLFYWTFVYNVIEIMIKIWAYGNIGWFKFRYLNLIQYEDPPFVQWCAFYNDKQENMKRSRSGGVANRGLRRRSSNNSNHSNNNNQLPLPQLQLTHSTSVSEYMNDNDAINPLYIPRALNYLTHEDWEWCESNLCKNFIGGDNYTIWRRKKDMVANWFDFLVMTFSILGVFFQGVIIGDYYDVTIFLQLPLLRLFTLIESNLQIGFEIITVANKSYAVIMVAVLFLFIWSRIGVSLFYEKTDVVLEDIYDYDANITFDSLGQGILTLLQIMIGEAWDEIMDTNVLATRSVYSIYFLIYVLIMTLFIVHIVTGLILAGMNSVKKQMMQASVEAQNAMRYRGIIDNKQSSSLSLKRKKWGPASPNKLETWKVKNRIFSVGHSNS